MSGAAGEGVVHDGDEIHVRIVGDGTWMGTRVTDARTGARIRGVSGILISAPTPLGETAMNELRATLTVFPMSVDLTIAGEIRVDGLELTPNERLALEWALQAGVENARFQNIAEDLRAVLTRLRRLIERRPA